MEMFDPDPEVEAKAKEIDIERHKLLKRVGELDQAKICLMKDYWIDKLNMYPGRVLEYRGTLYRFAKFDMTYAGNTRMVPWAVGHKILPSGKSHKSLSNLYNDYTAMPEGHELEEKPHEDLR